MEASELLNIISRGESSRVQFKERMPHIESMAYEMIAFSNSDGGMIIFGVNDKTGDLNGLNFSEIANINNQLTNIASNNILPPIFFETETVTINENNLVVVTVPQGTDKPYKDRSGNIYVKVGADKRKVTSNEMLSRLLQASRTLYADEKPVQDYDISNINTHKFEEFVKKRFKKDLTELDIPLPRILENLNLAKDGVLTLAGLLLFGKKNHVMRIMFTVQCVAINGVDIACDAYYDREDQIEGTLDDIFNATIGFINRNMRKVPEDKGYGFNNPSKWEIPCQVFEEFIVNALIHRDYTISSTIRIFIFNDRVEIISPGKLPNSLSVENAKNGISTHRNPILHSLARDILPYVGLGTGIYRALSLYPDIILENKTDTEQFKVTIKRNI
jgi:predicted HTH transcriptional regulator